VKLSAELIQQLAASGIRLTKQREEVFGMLLQKRDHPTAAELFLRAKRHMPSISLATIYNCLDALVACDLVKQVHVERAATRYCANLNDHSHFYCESCGAIADVETPISGAWKLAPGYVVSHAEVSLRGFCAKCSVSVKADPAHHSVTIASGVPLQPPAFEKQNSNLNPQDR
jgi:Fur family transcriptional regulator, peroxide stress response regulator